ncbi:MAG: sulfurtransferase, partial [Fusobacteriaceae bacterium]
MNFFKFAIVASIFATTIFAQNYKTLSTEQIKEVLKKENTIVVDTRTNDAFNGWALDGMKKGGHIEKATDFSANWLTVDMDQDKKDKVLKETLSNKGITKDKEVVLYDSNGKDALEVAKYLETIGIKNIAIYDLKKWKMENNPLKTFPNHKLIVPATWVNENLNKGYKVFEVSWGPEKMSKDYNDGHIPGAVHIDTDEIESAPLWSLNKDEELLKFAQKNGITKNDKIILYSTNPMASYRIAAILMYLGVSDVRVLNGGLMAWNRAGLTLEKKSNPKVPGIGFGSNKPLNKNLIVGIDAAKIIANSNDGHLVDIRSWEEHIGKITGYSDLDYKGRPKGAIWGKAGSDPNQL